ncbi:hypothetical protein [Nocardia goodfellowii]|uniref:Uncharacterized protein n=1 Tax=Nocardia goodfellowii TaxID=882446 RepID=A0ABS4QGD4_9NOCA|nr:hypothetical protein [Nocardia goodfellowii]MBP2190742.1 hypothetical protein [Nocardia goodfellowii]
MTTLLDATLEIRCDQYRSEFQMPASIDPASRHILLHIGRQYGAITMPSELGEQVQQRLIQAQLAAPVVHHPRARRWTFITGPAHAETLTAHVSAELFRLYATVACIGSQVVLPSPEDERTGYRVWVQQPEYPTALPPIEAVIEATRALGTRRKPHYN